jgi:subtilisin family serine protease
MGYSIMKILFFLFTIIILLPVTNLRAQSKISHRLNAVLSQSEKQETTIPAIIYLDDELDILALGKQLTESGATIEERAFTVITRLKEHAERTQAILLAKLKTENLAKVQPLWINNAIAVEALPSQIEPLSKHHEISLIDLDEGPKIIEPVQKTAAPSLIPNNAEIGLKVINAHKMWELGFSGEGVIVMNTDTGVEGDHPALAATWLGNEAGVDASAAWFDPQFSSNFPFDDDGHGSHTMGIMLGLDEATHDTIGIAFNAKWIAANTHRYGLYMYSESAMISAFQWALDPDGDPNTTDDIPAVVNCSWAGYTTCDNPFISSINALEEAGIAVVFALSNNGPTPGSVTGPGMNNLTEMNCFSVGAINTNNPDYYIAPFSGRGPTLCRGEGNNIKPEVAAPGDYVRSSIMNGKYAYWSGQSMAVPHVSGAIALLKQAFPQKTGAELKRMLYDSAHDMGVPGEDNDYGMGLIDVYAAYRMHAGELNPKAPQNFTTYSDHSSLTSISLIWYDPTHFVNGDMLINFAIDIFRNDELIQSIDQGVENYTDSGLNNGQLYTYSIKARDVETDSTSIAVSASVFCGGSPFPATPQDLECVYNENSAFLSWIDPSQQSDGTPLDDLEKIFIYRYGKLIDSVSAGVQSYTDTNILAFNKTLSYYLRTKDSESPFHLSANSKKAFCITTDQPDYLVWAGVGSKSPYFSSPDSLFEAIVANGESVVLTSYLFKYGNDLSIFKGVFAVLSYEYKFGGLTNNSPEISALNTYLSNGGKLYVEGTWELFNLPPAPYIPLYNMRPWFSLDKPSANVDKVASNITGYDFLSSFSFSYSGFFKTITALKPQNSVIIWKESEIPIGVYNHSYGSGGQVIGVIFPFGGLDGKEERTQLMHAYLDVLVSVDEPTIHTPFTFGLKQNYPNPFNPKTVICYQLPINTSLDKMYSHLFLKNNWRGNTQ